ncbi:MAG: hypothetical protein ACKOWQ_00520 [Aquirufa sp.]
MKKNITFVLISLFLGCQLFGQTSKVKFSISPGLIFPFGSLSNGSKPIGYGLDSKFEVPALENLSIFASVGFGLLPGEEIVIFNNLKVPPSDYTVVPVLGGINYRANKINIGISGGSELNHGGFTFRPHLGIIFTNHIELNINYTTISKFWSNHNYVGISPVFRF